MSPLPKNTGEISRSGPNSVRNRGKSFPFRHGRLHRGNLANRLLIKDKYASVDKIIGRLPTVC
jgi:hypothetical protein